MEEYSIGIDTSNYKTSVAVTDREGRVLCDERRFLEVAKGERGLRQQEALFQHVNALPDMIAEAAGFLRGGKVVCVSASERPRPEEGSYMPVFNAGVSAAGILAAAYECDRFSFSHQEGHIAAAAVGTKFEPHVRAGECGFSDRRFAAFHLSGGTTELLLVGERIEKIGGTLDIAAGQAVDRLGVLMGYPFPAGEYVDRLASGYIDKYGPVKGAALPKIKVNDGYFNLSGIDTAAGRSYESSGSDQAGRLCAELFVRLSDAISDSCAYAAEKYGVTDFLLMGGVSSSRTMRSLIPDKFARGLVPVFGDEKLSSDNAVGISLLGGKKEWL
jgi:N6-L-threonylcarbamoyladenine synthase